jgi:hypothetical protein
MARKHIAGATRCSDEQLAFRASVVETFLMAGIPLSIATEKRMRDLLETSSGILLTDRRQLADLIPVLLEIQRSNIRRALDSSDYISVIVDGATRQGQIVGIVFRAVHRDTLVPSQFCVRMKMLSRSYTGQILANILMECVSGIYSVNRDNIAACIHDAAAVNAVAFQFLSIVSANVIDIPCVSHMLNLVGEHMSTPVLEAFYSGLVCAWGSSARSKCMWSSIVETRQPTSSPTRWWSKYDVVERIARGFPLVERFVLSLQEEGFCPSISQKLCRILTTQRTELLLEVACTIDTMEPFVQACYYLEGDGFLMPEVYNKLRSLVLITENPALPNVQGVIESELARVDHMEHALMTSTWQAYVRRCYMDAYRYFQNRLEGDCRIFMHLGKAVRAFSPHIACCMSLEIVYSDLEELRMFKLFAARVDALKAELPAYKAASEAADSSIGAWEWWRRQTRCDYPTWRSTAALIFVLAPSSCATERVFSTLHSCVDESQDAMLEDAVELSVMMRYNTRNGECGALKF